ncbi:EAL domain-containing protein [Sphingomonas donggukensis]|uniref:EAL domain-containing protein n=1 Tax=Sphingomonas donggukensis TaxID=2949093 RepID=A0ABY4TUT6_9SPHN|nr:EAL domain-containing protein [Sphingomonas donggukensis]URW76170.1 EAL domain-containing protein [Sphingomonas donggukensis]
MNAVSLKSRAVAFALGAGMIAFVLALAATSAGRLDALGAAHALIPAIVCAVMCWACAERALASTAAAIDAAIARLTQAANGDLESEIPDEVAAAVPPLAGAMTGLFGQLHTQLDIVQQLAMFDQVTGLANRTNFRRSAERVLAAMPGDGAAAIFFIDLDRFKAVNDTLGHAVGDALLGMVADRLCAVAERFAPADGAAPAVIGRLAGDEFAMLFPAVGCPTEATRIGRGILFALSEPFDLVEQAVSVGASIGIALRPRHGHALTDLMRAADTAMYHAKASGRGRAELFSEALATEIATRSQLETDLRAAIERGEFALVYQPQIALTGNRLVAVEALLRWRHPSGALRLPGSFLQRAEDTGLIVDIGEWVIAAVADTIRRWGRMGIAQRLAINISARQLDHGSFFRGLRNAMRAADAPAHLLELEITETLAMQCSREVIDAIAALRADGATIAIDDFGTGYSNLARLRDLPVDRVKIDPCLIRDIAEAHHARVIVQAVIGLIHGLGMEAVAEGIETRAQIDVLRVLGCDVIQGFAIAEPMDEAAFLDWARTEPARITA